MKTFDIYFMMDGQRYVVESVSGKAAANKRFKTLKAQFREQQINLLMK